MWQVEVSLTQIFDRPLRRREFFEEIIQGLANLPYRQKMGRQVNRRLLEVERVSHNSGWSGDSIQRVVQPTVTEGGEQAPSLKFGQPRVMALW